MLSAQVFALFPIHIQTMILGSLAYVIATFCCILAWRVHRSRYWIAQAIFQSIMAIETWARLRHSIDLLSVRLLGRRLYAIRHYPQLIASATIGFLLLLASAWAYARLRRHGPPALLAILGTALSVLLFALAAISPHDVDHLMYRRVGPVMAVAWGWAAAALLVAIGAMLAARRRP